jgi:hypothetical protein
MSKTAKLDPGATASLLSALEAPEPVLAAATLTHLGPSIAAELLASGLIKPDGHEAAAISEFSGDDPLVALTWHDERQALGYFHPSNGWTSVPNSQILRYRIDVPALLAMMTSKLHFVGKRLVVPLVADRLWRIGDSKLPGRLRAPMFFGRRLHDAGKWFAMRQAIDDVGIEGRVVVLTSTRSDLLPDPIRAITVISIAETVLQNLAIPRSLITSRLGHAPIADDDEPLQVLGDGREVRFYGQRFTFPRGGKQRQVVNHLYERYKLGERGVATDEIIIHLDLPLGTRLHRLFNKNRAWGHLLTVKNGICSFCWPEEKV